jgi:hypothetical protein
MVQAEFGTQFLQAGAQALGVLDLGGVFEQHLVRVVDQARIQGVAAMQDQVLDGSVGLPDRLSAMAVSAISSTLVWLTRMRSA